MPVEPVTKHNSDATSSETLRGVLPDPLLRVLLVRFQGMLLELVQQLLEGLQLLQRDKPFLDQQKGIIGAFENEMLSVS